MKGGLYIVSCIVLRTHRIQSSALLAILKNLGDETNHALFPDPGLGNKEYYYTIMTIDELEDIHFHPNDQDNNSTRKPSRKENLARY